MYLPMEGRDKMLRGTLAGIIIVLVVFLFIAGIIASKIQVDLPYSYTTGTVWDVFFNGIKNMFKGVFF